MRYLGNDTNSVRDAALTATNGVASDAIYRTDTAPKEGGGFVELTGPYTGTADCTIDVEIVDNGGSTTTTSQPVFSGVGNGEMTDVVAAGVDPQTITATLVDLGTQTLKAYTSFQGATLRAKASGTSGNDITITVDHSGLVAGDTDWSLRDPLQPGTNEYVGDHWDFGAAIIDPDGSFPLSAPRLRFGSDPQVYRQGKKYVNGHYAFVFEPSPVRSVQAGQRVHTITGTRTVVVTDGVTPETYTGIITKYDALNAFLASDLIESDTQPVVDRQPSGMAISELSVFTSSYILGVTPTSAGPIANAELDITADPSAPTENLLISCADASIPGAEKWDVRGDVSGAQARATTGVTYANGTYTFTIPLPEVDPSATSGTITIDYSPDGPRDESATIPDFCAIRPLIGSAGRDGTWSFIYAHRPPADCDCHDGDYEGAPNYDCLGITPEGGDVSDASVMVRLQRITAEVATLSTINTDPPSGAPSTTVGYNDKTLSLLTTSAGILIGGLVKIPSGRTTWPAWAASATVTKDQIRTPSVPNGYRYAATDGGVTGSSEPVWPTTIGDTVTGDGGVDWVCLSQTPYESFDTAYAQWLDDVDYFATASELVAQVDVDLYNNRYRNLIADVLTTAEIAPNFDDASVDGDGCWHDYNDGNFWWVSEGVEPPYMPLQTGHYNYSAKQGFDQNGKPFIYSTKEWGFGIRIGCPESLVEGDRIKISVSGSNGAGSSGYAVGDAFSVQVNHALPLPFGGGQTGDDALTWSVVASDEGQLPQYTLVTTALAPYSESVGAGTIDFQITPGGIPFALGDSFVLAVEGGRFKWRQNGGSWSADTDIADTLLVDGLTATFAGGSAPSWVAGDRWSFNADATYGVDNLRTPIDGEFAWTGSTVIEVVPADGATVGIAIVNHSIPSDATITLQGSDDNFSTTPLSVVIPWRKGDIWHAVTADRAKYRVAIDRGGSVRWLYLGESTQPTTVGGLPELGRLTKRRRAPGIGVRAGMGADIEHTGLSQDGVDALQDMADHASANDDRLIAFVPNDARPEVWTARVPDTIDFDDIQGFQPENIAQSIQSCTVRLEAAA